MTYDKGGRKWCVYSCTRKDTHETKSITAPGHAEYCIGQEGGDEYFPQITFDSFNHDTDSWFDKAPLGYFSNGPEFNNEILKKFGVK